MSITPVKTLLSSKTSIGGFEWSIYPRHALIVVPGCNLFIRLCSFKVLHDTVLYDVMG